LKDIRKTVVFAEDGISLDALLSVEAILEQVEQEERERQEREKRKTVYDLKADEVRNQREQLEKDRIAAWLARKKTHTDAPLPDPGITSKEPPSTSTSTSTSDPTTSDSSAAAAASAVASAASSTEDPIADATATAEDPIADVTTTATISASASAVATAVVSTASATANHEATDSGARLPSVHKRPSVYGVPADEWEAQRKEKERSLKEAIRLEEQRASERKEKEREEIRKRLTMMDEQLSGSTDTDDIVGSTQFIGPESAQISSIDSEPEPIEEEVEAFVWEDRFANRYVEKSDATIALAASN
jgi:hypothetical protein